MIGDKRIQNGPWQGRIAVLLLILAIIAVPAVALGADLASNTAEPTAGVLKGIPPTGMEGSTTPEQTPTEATEVDMTQAMVERSQVSATSMTHTVDASGGGDYTTIGAAVAAAGPSDTIVVRKGDYTENIIVDKVLTIRSESGPEGTIVAPADQGAPVFSFSTNGATVAGLTIRGVSGGVALVSLSGASGCVIEDNVISTSKIGISMADTRDNKILNNTLDTISEAGIDLKRAESDLISGNTLTSCNYGIRISDSGNQYSYRVKIQDNIMTECNIVIYLKYKTQDVEVINNTMTNGKYGFYIVDGPTGNIITGNTIQQQSAKNGIFLRNTHGNLIYLNTIRDNVGDVAVSSASASWNSTEPITYVFENTTHTGYVGNYWDRYVGPDADGDGIGDEPYVVSDTQKDYYPIVKPSNRIVTVTPDNVTLTAGDGLQFTAVLSDREGTEIPDAGFTWTSSDEAVGTVNTTGYFSALKAGTATVGATSGGVAGTAHVSVQRAETPAGGVIPAVDDVHLKVANDAGVRFNDFGDGSFRIRWSGGGQNAQHISNGSGSEYGEVTETTDLSGTFYVTNTGGRGYFDNVFLCVAVNGTIPDDFRLHIRADGYQWTPLPICRDVPTPENRTYVNPTVDEWFTKDDLIYGPQTWRPAAGTTYPIYPGQDVSDESNRFRIMFVDLKTGVLHGYPMRVNYTIENLQTMAAFNVYGYSQNVDEVNDYLTTWTNRLIGNTGEFSGWYVYGTPLPVADFTANVMEGESPLAVAFTDASTGSPTSWAWDFDNDGTVDSTEQNPSHTYTATGTYTVNLTVTNEAGSDAKVKKDYISVINSSGGGTPVANFTANITTGDAPLAVLFTDTSTGSPTTWAWDFDNDGTVDSTEQNPTHTYTTPGTYTVNLTVTNDAGSNSAVKTDYITVSASQPEVTYYVDPSGAGNFLTIQDAVDHASDGNTIIVRDGTYPECVVVNRPLTITSANGPEKTLVSPSASNPVFTIASDGVTIRGLGIANANGNGIDCSGYQNCVIEDNVITGTGTEYGVYLHPGNNSAIRNNVITSQGYGVMIIGSSGDVVENNTVSSTIRGVEVYGNSHNMTITSNTIESTGSTSSCISLRIHSNIEDVHVEGNSVSGGQVAVLLYETRNISVLDNRITGGSRYAIQASDVNNADLRGNTIIAGSRTGLYAYRLTGFKVWLNNFTLTQSNNWGLVEVGIPSLNSMAPITYTYANTTHTGYLGNYYSTYTGTDADGDGIGDTPFIEEKVASGEVVTVYDHHPLISPPEHYRVLTIIDVGSISISPPSATLGVGESRIFTAELFDLQGEKLAGVSPLWSSSNTTVGVVNEITGSFDALAVGTTIVTAAAGGATDVAEVTVTVALQAPVANFTANVTAGDAPLAVQFTDTSTGTITSRAWDFGDTTTSTEQNPTYTYTTPGTYTVNLTVTNDAGSNSAVKTDYITVTELYVPQPARIVVTPPTAELAVGATQAFAATVYDTDEMAMNGAAVTWASSNETVGMVNTAGLFTARAPGTTTVTAAYANVAGTAVVTVTRPQGDQTQNAPLNIPGCNVTTGNDGKPQVSINTTATNATVNGTTIRIAEGNFTLTIETEGAPTNESGTLNGTIANIRLDTNPVVTELGSVGTVSASVSANLTGLPAGAGLTTTISQNVSSDAQSAFQLAASDDGLALGDVAYTLNIVKTNLDNGQDIASATIRMTVSPAWVAAHGGVDAIRIIRSAEDGTKEVLTTTLVGTDADGNMVFEAASPNGLSIFGLAAATAASQPSQASSSSGGSSGSSTSVGAASNLKSGESVTLTMDATAVSAVTLTANTDIKDLMVTVAKGSLPRDAELPAGTVYQYVQATLYKAAEADFSSVQLRFAVPAPWLAAQGCTAEQVTLFRYADGAWQAVPVETLGEENGNAVFSAASNGFGLLAIAVTEQAPGAAGDVTPQPTATGSPVQAEAAAQTAGSTPTPQATPLPVWAAILAFGFLLFVRRT